MDTLSALVVMAVATLPVTTLETPEGRPLPVPGSCPCSQTPAQCIRERSLS